jgi:hypothetical protein
LTGKRPWAWRARPIGFTGRGNGTHQVDIRGLTDHRLKDSDTVDHLVELVEKKAAEIKGAKQSEAELAAAQYPEVENTARPRARPSCRLPLLTAPPGSG